MLKPGHSKKIQTRPKKLLKKDRTSNTVPSKTFDDENLKCFFRAPVIPNKLEESILAYISKKTGKPWNDPQTISKIQHYIRIQKDEYWQEAGKRKISYVKGYRVFSYLTYHLPVYFIQFEHLLFRLISGSYIPEKFILVDMGSGPGVVTLATADLIHRRGKGYAEIYAFEKAPENIEAYNFLVSSFTGKREDLRIHNPVEKDITTLQTEDLPQKIDLLVFQNVLCELSDISIKEKALLIRRFRENLGKEGILLLVEPAELENSTKLREIERELKKNGFKTISPCPKIMGDRCTDPTCWTFKTEYPLWAPEFDKVLAAGAEGYRFMNTDIKYSYSILKQDDGFFFQPGYKNYIPCSSLKLYVGRRVRIIGSVMSQDIGDKKHHIFKVCDGTARNSVYVILPHYHISQNNNALLKSSYGEIFRFDPVFVRINKAYGSINLLISKETRISKEK